DFDWVVKECQLPVDALREREVRSGLDPKGFWRIDKELDPGERLTNLAASAFRALKAGKWTATTAAAMSNDEVFALLGIPDMTAGPEPLIRRREGSHHWKPEEFGPEDTRHGWTWEDCLRDAAALGKGSHNPTNGEIGTPGPLTPKHHPQHSQRTLF